MRTRTLLFVLAICLAPIPALSDPGDQATFDRGVAAYDAGQYEEAFKIFSDLADNDDVAAMRNVALMYRRGQGVARDPEKAIDWYEKAAEAGLGTAQGDLGIMLLDGEAGKPDPEGAVKWLTAASQAGHANAQFRLGQLYEQGQYVTKDLDTAKKLYTEAAAHGQKQAAARLAELSPETQTSSVVMQPLPPRSAADGPVRTKTKKYTQPQRATAIRTATAPAQPVSQPAPPPAPAPVVAQAPAVQPASAETAAQATVHKTFASPPGKVLP